MIGLMLLVFSVCFCLYFSMKWCMKVVRLMFLGVVCLCWVRFSMFLMMLLVCWYCWWMICSRWWLFLLKLVFFFSSCIV